MCRMAMASSMTTGRFSIVSNARMAQLGWLMIGTLMSVPYGPGLVIVNVLPCTSSGMSCLARARVATSLIALRQAGHAHRVGALDDRDDQAVVERDRDAEVHVALQDQLVAAELGVHVRVCQQRVADRLRDERHVGEADALALLERVLRLRAQAHDVLHVDLDQAPRPGRGLQRRDHVVPDRLAHPGQRDELLALAGDHGNLRGRGGSRWRRGSLRRGRDRGSGAGGAVPARRGFHDGSGRRSGRRGSRCRATAPPLLM